MEIDGSSILFLSLWVDQLVIKKRELNPKFERRDGFNLIFQFFKQSHTESKQGYTENKQCCIEESQFWKNKNKFLKTADLKKNACLKVKHSFYWKIDRNKLLLEFWDEANAIVKWNFFLKLLISFFLTNFLLSHSFFNDAHFLQMEAA